MNGKRFNPWWIAVGVVLVVALADVLRFALTPTDGISLEQQLTLFAQQLLNALTLGGIYALIAVGYTLIYGIVKLINFAHGEIYMLGAFFGILLITQGFGFFVAVPLAMVGCAVVSMTMDQIAYRPLRQQFRSGVLVPLIVILSGVTLALAVLYMRQDLSFTVAFFILLALCTAFVLLAERFAFLPMTKDSPRLAALITAIGMSLFLQNAAMLVFGAEIRPFPELRQDRQVLVGLEKDATRALPEGDRKILEEAIEQALVAAEEERWDAVPFLYSFHQLSKAVVAAHKYQLPDLADKEGKLSVLVNELARLRRHAIATEEGRLLVSLEFAGTTSNKANQEFRRDLKRWVKNQTTTPLYPGLGLAIGKDIEFQDIKAKHVFDVDLVEATFGEAAPGTRRIRLPVKTVFVWVSAILILFGMNTLVHHTSFGAAMRACALDKEAASLMGVNVNRVIMITFLLSGAMAAVAGVLFGLYIGSGIYYRMGFYAGVIAFFAAVLGGIGNLKGAVLGGLILGFVQAISEAYVTHWITERVHNIGDLLGRDWSYVFNAQYAYAIACIILITVILIRPTGILGSSEVDRA